jgi:ATP-binding cassette, subfamily B, bacterial PglK
MAPSFQLMVVGRHGNFIVRKNPVQPQHITKLMKQLWYSLAKNRRRQFKYLIILMSFVSFTEAISIGAVVPFLAVLTNPSSIYEFQVITYLLNLFNISSDQQFLVIVTIVFAGTALIAGAMRILLLWAITKLSFSIGFDFGVEIYDNVLHQSYEEHTSYDSSQVLNVISVKINDVIFRILSSVMVLIGNIFMMIAILIFLLYLEPTVACVSVAGFSAIYLVIARANRSRLADNSKRISYESDNTVKILQEGLGSIRDILLDGNQSVYKQIFRQSNRRLRVSQGRNDFITQSPRYLMESLAIILISFLAYFLTLENDNISNVVPILGAMALGGQRLLPLFQRAYMSWSSVTGYADSLSDVIDFLNIQKSTYSNKNLQKRVIFNENIELKGIYFYYKSSGVPILKNINLEIEKGDFIGFIGQTGSGKSTLIDIVMGLLQPTSGVLKIDNVEISEINVASWQSHIAHVPQDIYLINDTVEKNIAFGIPNEKIDFLLVKEVTNIVQLSKLIEGWDNQYKTVVGERGAQLSGGQRQRIGIARALYKKSQVIIFDEASSALDGKTEEIILNNIKNNYSNTTILMIAHRINSLKDCNKIVELEDTSIKRICHYDELIY